MRKVLSLLILWLTFAVGLVFGQETGARMTPEQFYRQCGGVCDPVSQGDKGVRAGGGAVPYETSLYVYFRSSTGEFAQRGEEVKLWLDVVRAYDRPVSIYGRRAKLNEFGGWTSFDYYSAEGGDGGWFPNLRVPQAPILAYSSRVSGDQQMGDIFEFDIAIADAQTGQGLQQAFTRYVVGANYKRISRGIFFLDRAYLSGQDKVVLEGVLPTQQQMAVEFIAHDQFAVNVPIPPLPQAQGAPFYTNQLKLMLGVYNPASTAVDVVMALPSMRQHYTLRKAFVVVPTAMSVPSPKP